MVDFKVMAAQKWVNKTYQGQQGYIRIAEDGITGWNTIHALIRALQIELDIPGNALSDNFGPQTLAKLTARGGIHVEDGWGLNPFFIVQSALFCKGYDAGAIDGQWGGQTSAAVRIFYRDANVPLPAQKVLSPTWTIRAGEWIDAKMVKALLTMDAYVKVDLGTDGIREGQQWLNNRYYGRDAFAIVPCDGIFNRTAQQALLYAIQFEMGLKDSEATGTFGPKTQAALRVQTIASPSVGPFVSIFSTAMVFNRVSTTLPPVETIYVGVTDRWSGNLSDAVREFQRSSELAPTGVGDFATWAQLLVSTGDPNRPVTGCDTTGTNSATGATLDDKVAKSLAARGFSKIGRYLQDYPGGTLKKELKPPEILVLLQNGFAIFPIWQMSGDNAKSFSYDIGKKHGAAAHAAASRLLFPKGTTIYFAVDYDADQNDITRAIIPYFRGVVRGLAGEGDWYSHGVYGTRNVCIDVSSKTSARWSYVSGMSTGYSGNLGFPMPSNWSLNQIQEIKAPGLAPIDIDRVAYKSNSDPGVRIMRTEPLSASGFISYIGKLYELARATPFLKVSSLSVLDFLRQRKYSDLEYVVVLKGDLLNHHFLSRANDAFEPGVFFIDPLPAQTILHSDHLGYTVYGVFTHQFPPIVEDPANAEVDVNQGDVAGWLGDWIQLYGAWREQYRVASPDTRPKLFCAKYLATGEKSPMDLRNFIEDVDGFHIGNKMRKEGVNFNLAIEIAAYYGSSAAPSTRFTRFYYQRFGGNIKNAILAARNGLTPSLISSPIIRGGSYWILKRYYDELHYETLESFMPWSCPPDLLDELCQAFGDCMVRLVNEEKPGI
ncbi:hypothetical protein BKA63DRAFT_191563 [Paraphoma chrysanthemicola]|nr:hypothetical protein BKA63DRAFT_191563 [Paraphoma chrysanthemicola]